MNYKKFAYSALVLIFLFINRLWSISLFPAALTHDEIVYAAQAKSLAIQGTFLNQTDGWLSLQPAHPMYAELPAKLMAPFFLLFKNPLLATRALSVFMGIALPFVLAWLSFGIWKNKNLSLIVLGVAAVNPLLWQMSRLAYDAVYTTFFYLLGGAILLNVSSRNKLWSLIPLLMGFFCYQGYKLVFLPWILFLLLVDRKPTIKVGLVSLAVFLGYLLILLPNQQVENRWQQTIFADLNYQAATTNDNRRLTLDNPIAPLLSNKAVAIFQYLTKRFVGAFSLDMLFLNGEPAQSAFAVWGHGWFYLFDLVLVIFGLTHLLSTKSTKRSAYYLLGFIVIAVIPSTINSGESWYLLRTFLPNVLLLLVVSWGMLFFWSKWYFRVVIGLIYLLSIGYFGYYFYFRYPILGTNISYLSERVAINYIDRVQQEHPNKQIYFYTIDPPVMFWNYLVYSPNILQKNNASQIAEAGKSNDYTLGNVTFIDACPDLTQTEAVIISEQWRIPCEQSQSTLANASDQQYKNVITSQKSSAITIPSIVDNGAYFRIFGNSICNFDLLPHFIGIKNVGYFSIDRQTNKEFCQRWLSNVSINN